jgi:heat shock protein HslJ
MMGRNRVASQIRRGGASALLLVLAVGCTPAMPPSVRQAPAAATPSPPSPPSLSEAARTDPHALAGTRWRLVEAEGRLVPSAPPVTLNFEAARFGGHGGCNNYGGRYRIDAGRIVVEEVASTLIGCQGPVGETEQLLFRGLGGAFGTAIEPDGRLAIVRDGRTVLRFLPVATPPPMEPRALIGTRWRLIEVGGAPVARWRYRNEATLEFGARSFGGHSGCNDYGTGYEIEGRRFVTASIEADAIGCLPPVSTVEERLFRALGGGFEFEIDAEGRLVILKDGAAALRFARIAPPPPLAARPEPAALIGTRWRLVEADGRRIRDDPAYEMVTLDIGEGDLSGSSGCNGYSARYRLQGRRFLPTPVTATQRGCAPPIGPLERRLFQLLGAPFEVDADAEGRLVIVSGGAPALRFEPR